MFPEVEARLSVQVPAQNRVEEIGCVASCQTIQDLVWKQYSYLRITSALEPNSLTDVTAPQHQNSKSPRLSCSAGLVPMNLSDAVESALYVFKISIETLKKCHVKASSFQVHFDGVALQAEAIQVLQPAMEVTLTVRGVLP